MLSESYPAIDDVAKHDLIEVHDGDKTSTRLILDKNPLNITVDPEFMALNPGLTQWDILEAASALVTLSTNTDITWALTSYLNSDSDARAFLDGEPDPWGMVVNANYLNIALPVSSWPLLDGFVDEPRIAQDDCYRNSPSPWLSLVARPTALLDRVVQTIQYGRNFNEMQFRTGDLSPQHGDDPRQQPGHRFVIGITSLSEAARYGLDTAQLQTAPSSDPKHPGDGTFIGTTEDALGIAVGQLRPDDTLGTWPIPYSTLGATAVSRQAYPGLMVVYADVPTVGLVADDASHLAALLRFIATEGQQTGIANGQPPLGYLPTYG